MFISGTDSAEICSSFKAPFDIACPSGYSVNQIRTNYDRNSRDRYYCIVCRYNIRGIKDCYKTGYAVNSSDGSISLKCNNNYYIAGVESLYHKEKNDRSFALKCCRNVGQCIKNCHSTGILNTAGGSMNYRVKRNEFIVGASSTYDGSTM